MKGVISEEVICPWCGAQPGEPCTEGSPTPPYVRKLPYGTAHTARTTPALNPGDPLSHDPTGEN